MLRPQVGQVALCPHLDRCIVWLIIFRRVQTMLDAFCSVTLCTADSKGTLTSCSDGREHNAIYNAASSALSILELIKSRVENHVVLKIVGNVNQLVDAFGNALKSAAKKWISKTIAHATSTRTNPFDLPWDVDKYGIPHTV